MTIKNFNTWMSKDQEVMICGKINDYISSLGITSVNDIVLRTDGIAELVVTTEKGGKKIVSNMKVKFDMKGNIQYI